MAREAGVPIEMRIPPGLPLMLGDHGPLVQVVVNLLSNAAKFSPRSVPVVVSAAADGAVVSLSIQDRGRGIAPDDVDRLFEKHHQAGGSTTPGTAGTGFGLAIAKDIVDQHGGRITVVSPPGDGTTFTVSIPRAPGESRTPEGRRSKGRGRRARIDLLDAR